MTDCENCFLRKQIDCCGHVCCVNYRHITLLFFHSPDRPSSPLQPIGGPLGAHSLTCLLWEGTSHVSHRLTWRGTRNGFKPFCWKAEWVIPCVYRSGWQVFWKPSLPNEHLERPDSRCSTEMSLIDVLLLQGWQQVPKHKNVLELTTESASIEVIMGIVLDVTKPMWLQPLTMILWGSVLQHWQCFQWDLLHGDWWRCLCDFTGHHSIVYCAMCVRTFLTHGVSHLQHWITNFHSSHQSSCRESVWQCWCMGVVTPTPQTALFLPCRSRGKVRVVRLTAQIHF